MTNAALADNFSLLSKLIDIHGEDSFKAKSYSSAAFTIDNLSVQLSSLSHEKIFAIKGIGQATGKKVIEQLETGRMSSLDEYILKTPAGILELLNIKGLGPKKIATVWNELGIESVGELLYACEENRLLLYKGFGEKTQQNILDSIRFYISGKGSYLYGQIEEFAIGITEKLRDTFPENIFEITGDFNRQMEVIHKLEWMTNATTHQLTGFFETNNFEVKKSDKLLSAKGAGNIALDFHCVGKSLNKELFDRNCSPEFLQEWQKKYGDNISEEITTEEDIFSSYSLPYIPVCYRETARAIREAEENILPNLITAADIKGIIHTHSDWSDGKNTIEEMVKYAIAKGYEYLVISDHSQSAFYAKGLFPERIKAQHELIDELNEKYKPFRIFKSIESDILNDGRLDYPDAILSTFDLVITSVHSNLKMTEEKAMLRLMNAIANPFTTILGHMTGRLLLSRNGYPVNYSAIIEACVKHKVVIELNAHSRRLDMDWRQIPAAIDAGVLISIDPDAHATSAFHDVRYGVLVAQKGGLTAAHNLSSFSLVEFENYLLENKRKR